MKKIAVLLLALSLVCGVLTGCASDKGNIDDTDGVVTDSHRDDDSIIDDDIIDDDMTDGDKNGDKNSSDNKGSGNSSGSSASNSGGNNDAPVPTSIPGDTTAGTQPVTP